MSPESGFKQILAQNQIDWFHDIKAATKPSHRIVLKDNSVYFPAVLSSQKFQDFVYSRVKIRQPEKPREKKVPKQQRLNSNSDRYNLSFDSYAAQKQLEQMHSRVTKAGLRSMVWFFNKTMRVGLQGLYVHEESLRRVKSLADEGKRVVLVPIYKSFADFFIQQFINYKYSVNTPFTFGNGEDTPRIKLFDMWLKSSGYMIATRRSDQNLQQSYINSALLKEIIEHNPITTIF